MKNDILGFLDIDGVLNNRAYARDVDEHSNNGKDISQDILFSKHSKADWVATDLVRLLDSWCGMHDVGLVGISSWFVAKHEWNEFKELTGLPIFTQLDNTTGGDRSGRIREWMELYGNCRPFLVFDDAWSYYKDKTNCVRIDGQYGLSDRDLWQATNILESQV